jgi:hypothetical protein
MKPPIREWWLELPPEAREWLIQHRAEPVPANVVEQIAAAGGPGTSVRWWISGDDSTSGFYLSPEAQRWIEELSYGG